MIPAKRGIWLALLAVGAGAAAGACASPEATRARGGGPGADQGNRSAVTRIHGGAKMYYGTPCRVPKSCTGPKPVFGTSS